MGAGIVPVVLVLAVLVLVGAGVWALGRRQERERRQVIESDTVEFRVPEGQDPAPVIASLHEAGYRAVLSSAATDPVIAVSVDSRDASAREAVRRHIADAPLNFEGDRSGSREVRFLDE